MATFEEHIPKAIPRNIQQLVEDALGKSKIDEIHAKFYSATSEHDYFQGNVLENLFFAELPSTTVGKIKGMVISNPCDTEQANNHRTPPRVTYCAVKTLAGYEQTLIQYSTMTEDEVASYIANIRRQKISDIIFIPAGQPFEKDMIGLLGHVASSGMSAYEAESRPNVLARLSQEAYYLFLTKLSIHYLRFGEIAS